MSDCINCATISLLRVASSGLATVLPQVVILLWLVSLDPKRLFVSCIWLVHSILWLSCLSLNEIILSQFITALGSASSMKSQCLHIFPLHNLSQPCELSLNKQTNLPINQRSCLQCTVNWLVNYVLNSMVIVIVHQQKGFAAAHLNLPSKLF